MFSFIFVFSWNSDLTFNFDIKLFSACCYNEGFSLQRLSVSLIVFLFVVEFLFAVVFFMFCALYPQAKARYKCYLLYYYTHLKIHPPARLQKPPASSSIYEADFIQIHLFLGGIIRPFLARRPFPCFIPLLRSLVGCGFPLYMGMEENGRDNCKSVWN